MQQHMQQQRPITTATHGILDVATVGFALAYTKLFSTSRLFRVAATGLALGKLGYALCTKHEVGIKKLIPMKTHLKLDTIGGATLVALPFVLGEKGVIATCCSVSLGLFDIAAAPMTQTNDVEEGSMSSMSSSQGRGMGSAMQDASSMSMPQSPRMEQASPASQASWAPTAPSMAAGVPVGSGGEAEAAIPSAAI